MRRGIVFAAALSVLCAPAVHAAPLPGAPAVVWVAERVSRGARQVVIDANVTWDRRGGRVTYVAAALDRGRPRPFDAMTVDSPLTDGPAAYAGGTAYGCYAGSGCDVASGPGATEFMVAYPPGATQPERVYLVVSGASATVRLVDSPGWRLARTALRARYATSDGGGAVGAQVLGEHVERFEHASMAGGRRGSLAVATPPCRPLHRAGVVREGYGTATLTGGTARVDFDCRRDLHDLSAAADRATVWSFDGPVVGTATGTTRLVVIDL